MEEMKVLAKQKGANAIVGIDVDYEVVRDGMLMVAVSGTCVNRQNIEESYPKWKNRELTGVRFMALLELKKNTFYKIIKEYESTLNQNQL